MTTCSSLDLLRTYESQNVTFFEADGSWPIVWDRAKGVNVWDEDGKRYLDLTAAFGVAAAGHANPRVVAAGRVAVTPVPAYVRGWCGPKRPDSRERSIRVSEF